MNRTVTQANLLLTAEQMQQVDRCAAQQGVDTFALMMAAGQAVADFVLQRYSTAPSVLVLAGSGNNGGDGYIAAEALRRTGLHVVVVRFSSGPRTHSDAAQAHALYQGMCISIDKDKEQLPADVLHEFAQCDLIIDALFGAGLSHKPTGAAASLIAQTNLTDVPVVSVDLPSGLDGNEHRVQALAIQAAATVSFFRAKPAHYLYPGRALCGELVLAQIGLTDAQLLAPPYDCFRNDASLFASLLPYPTATVHKYQRGHVLVRSGPMESTGAARLSANTALSCGAGAVSLATDADALGVNAAHLTAVMLARCDQCSEWTALLTSRNIDVAVIGPGNGVNEKTNDCVLQSLETGVSHVLDADALSCWREKPQVFIEALQAAKGENVLTPHSGEFNRLFGQSELIKLPSKLHQAKAAAQLANTIIVYKGADTVIASPDGRVVINCNAPAWLATAGAGDVLAGAIAALHAQGMPLFESALAAVWLHSEAAMRLGYPMNAEQLVMQISAELNRVVTAIK